MVAARFKMKITELLITEILVQKGSLCPYIQNMSHSIYL